ncbi:MAG: DUF1801 domain-containing protein [Candidatus Paceibacterota bacterium]
MSADIKELYISKINPDFKEVVKKLIKIIESTDKNLDCEIKWGRLTYGILGDYHHWICGIDQTKKSINLIFHFGGILDDKNKNFIAGNSFFLRKLEYLQVSDINETVVKDFVKQAISKLDYFKNNWKELNKNSKL